MRIRCVWIGVLVALLVPAVPALAANQTVTATNLNTFSPKTVVVNTGDMVTWNNGGGFHNVHFDDNSFDMPASPSSAAWSVSRTFTSPGTFRYYCEAHGGPNGSGMSGTVWVNGPGYARPAGASPLRASLSIAYKQCQAPTEPHAWAPARASVLQPAGAGVRLADGGHTRRQRAGRELGRIRHAPHTGGGPGHTRRPSRRARSPHPSRTCATRVAWPTTPVSCR